MITPQKILEFFPTYRGVEFADSGYAVPDYDWLVTEFFPFYDDFLNRFNAKQWRTSHDCDDKARTFCVLASLVHGQKNRGRAEGIAIAEVWYYSTTLEGYHAINCAVVSNQRAQPSLIFIEPQIPAVIELTKSELSTMREVRF